MLRSFIIIISLFFISPSFAKDDSLLTVKQQLDRLQREVSDISLLVFKQKNINNNDNEKELLNSSALTTFDLRIYDLEKDIEKLNENFEELIFQIDDLKSLYEEINIVTDSKINSLKENLVFQNNNEIQNIDNNEAIVDVINQNENKSQNSLGNIIIKSEDLSDQKKQIIIVESTSELKKIILTPEEEFQIAFDLLRSQKFNEAKNVLHEFIENHKDNRLSGSAHYWLGEIYLLKKEYRESALILAEGYQKYPKSLKAPEMLYKLSESLINIDKMVDACNTLIKLKLEFSKHKIFNKTQDKIVELECDILSE